MTSRQKGEGRRVEGRRGKGERWRQVSRQKDTLFSDQNDHSTEGHSDWPENVDTAEIRTGPIMLIINTIRLPLTEGCPVPKMEICQERDKSGKKRRKGRHFNEHRKTN